MRKTERSNQKKKDNSNFVLRSENKLAEHSTVKQPFADFIVIAISRKMPANKGQGKPTVLDDWSRIEYT